jgi:hypothetical protein
MTDPAEQYETIELWTNHLEETMTRMMNEYLDEEGNIWYEDLIRQFRVEWSAEIYAYRFSHDLNLFFYESDDLTKVMTFGSIYDRVVKSLRPAVAQEVDQWRQLLGISAEDLRTGNIPMPPVEPPAVPEATTKTASQEPHH